MLKGDCRMASGNISNGVLEKSMKSKFTKYHKRKLSRRLKRHSRSERNIIPTRNTNKQVPYLIIENNTDYTPKALDDSDYPSININLFTGLQFSKKKGQQITKLSSKTPSSTSILSGLSRFSKVVITKKPTYSSLSSMLFSETVSVNLSSIAEDEVSETEKAPSLFLRREDPLPRDTVIQTEFTVNLKETDTFFLLEIRNFIEDDCIIVETDTEIKHTFRGNNGNTIWKQYVDDRSSGKNMKQTETFSHTAVQTSDMSRVMKKRYVNIGRNTRKDSGSYTTKWDIYDIYQKEETKYLESEIQEGETNVKRHDYNIDFIHYKGVNFSTVFFNTIMTMERLISAHSNKEKQRLFVGFEQPDPLSKSVQFNYNLRLLWTLKNDLTENKVVTGISLSPVNVNLLAVGYGIFKYNNASKGAVCCWNIKNPVHAERTYRFDSGVTSVSFSNQFPYMLAVSFYSGLVILLDVTKRNVVVLASNETYPLHHPVWNTYWFPNEDITGKEYLVTCGRDGKVYRYRKTEIFKSKKILSVARMYSRIQGIEQSKRCYANKTLVSRHPAVKCIVPHPEDSLIYFIGTSEGCIYKCSVNYCHHHLDVFAAHNGPVYGIQFHPHCNKIFLTYGGDWYIRVWAEGIFEPLVALNSGMQAVEAAVWDPLHATIIISIIGDSTEVWDIRRKTYTPKSVSKSPTNAPNTVLAFTKNGFNLCVGDTNGHLHVYALMEMPFSPVFQESILVQCLVKILVCKPTLLRRLRKLGPPFSDDYDTHQKKLYLKLKKFHHL